MTVTETILNILNEQVKGYRELFELLQQEKECLIVLNAECIEELSKIKDTLLLKLKLLEEERIRLMKDFGDENMNIKKLAEVTGEGSFLNIRSKLLSLIQSINELNNFNKILIERSIAYSRSTSLFFTSSGIGEKTLSKGLLYSGEI